MRINMKYVRIFLSPIVFVFIFILGFIIPFYILFLILGITQIIETFFLETEDRNKKIEEGFIMMICFLIIPYLLTIKFINNEY